MKNFIKLEEAGLFLFAFYLFLNTNYPVWLFFALLFIPDISMIGYLWNAHIGAILYNLIHFRAIALILYIIGIIISAPYLMLAGIILFAHSSMDRVFGYGLKLSTGFKHTHLGELH